MVKTPGLLTATTRSATAPFVAAPRSSQNARARENQRTAAGSYEASLRRARLSDGASLSRAQGRRVRVNVRRPKSTSAVNDSRTTRHAPGEPSTI